MDSIWTDTGMNNPDSAGGFNLDTAWATLILEFTTRAPKAVAVSNVVTTQQGFPVGFDATGSYDLDGTIVSYEWDWETDGIYDATGITASHTFLLPRTYVVTLKVTDNDGLIGFDTVAITVTQEPNYAPTAVATASVSTTFVGTKIDFDASGSSDPNYGDTLTYHWKWESGANYDTIGMTVSHTFLLPGTYEVTLKVTDSKGLSSFDTVTITVLLLPVNVVPEVPLGAITALVAMLGAVGYFVFPKLRRKINSSR